MIDHDRNLDHNWVSDRQNNLLFWDSGLAFNHGPYARTSCLDLLCGQDKWRDRALETSTHCRRICRFRRSTIELIRRFGPTASMDASHKWPHAHTHTLKHQYCCIAPVAEPTERLGYKLCEALQEDNLAPVFQFNLFYTQMSKFPKVKFEANNFCRGMDTKVNRLLRHVEKCIVDYGEENVLLDSLE
jgi:hypothetical protein